MKKGLGKGLGALLTNDSINNLENTKDTINEKDKVLEIDINKIQIDKAQPRKSFDEESLLELANSIKEVGIINPIIVKQKDEFYEIISGERRFRACKILKLKKIPVLIREYDEIKKLEVALIENIQRENLNPIEEAMIYKKFQDEFSLSQEEISERVGKKRTTIANAVRLLKLDKRVQNFIIELKISQGHAKALLTLDNKETQFELAEKIIEESLSVRQTEDLVKKIIENEKLEKENNKKYETIEDEARKQAFETISKQLNQIFGTKVKIKDKNNKGKIEIEYYSEEELERLVGLFKKI